MSKNTKRRVSFLFRLLLNLPAAKESYPRLPLTAGVMQKLSNYHIKMEVFGT